MPGVAMNVEVMQMVQSILVIEDNEGDFFLLKEVLESGDLKVGEIINVSNFEQLREKAASLSPSLIFLDLVMPDSYGLPALAEIKELFPASPVIIISGLSDLQLALDALQKGAQDYLVKGEFDDTMLNRSIQYSIERKKNELAVIESENRLRTILNTDPECIKLMGRNCELYEINKAGMEMIEIDDFETVKGKSILAVVETSYQAQAAKMVADAFEGKSGLMEFEMITLKGRRRWCEINIVPYLNAEGKIIHALGVTRDVTVRKKKEEELRSSEDIRKLIMDSALDAIICVDRNEVIFTWNPQAEEIFGWKEQEAIGKKLSSLVIHKRYHSKHHNGFANYQATGKSPVLNKIMILPAVRSNGDEFIAELVIREIKNGDDYFLCTYVRDVTERIQAEKELKQSNSRFQRITSTTNDAVWEWNLENNTLWCNEMHQQLYGLTMEDPVPVKAEWVSRIHPEDRFRILKMQDDALASDTNVFISEYRFRAGKGIGYRYIFDRCYINRNTEGEPILMTGSMMDITERKLAEEKIIHSNERFELIAKTTNDAVWETDLETGVSWGNEMHQMMYGLTLENEIPNFEDWEMHLHPDDRDWVVKSLHEALASTDNTWITEYRFLKSSGEIVTIYDRTYIVRNKEGKPVRMMGSMMDITERKKVEDALLQSEEKYRTLVEQATDGIFIADHTGKFVIVNSAAVKLSKYTEEELANLTIYDLADPEEIKTNPFRFEEMKSEQGARSERKLKRKDGSILDIEINAKFLSDGRFLAFIRDITERKKAEDELNSSYKAIRKLTSHLQNAREEERTHIAREIHDELGQQLTVLKMDVSWLNKKIKQLENQQLNEKATEIVQMLNDTVNTVRRISSDLRPVLLDDLGLAAAIEWHLMEFGKRSGIKTEFFTLESAIEIPRAIATGLFRIYQESITNIARHSEATEVMVELFVEDKVVTMAISDNGKGFDVTSIGRKKTLGVLGMQERTVMMGGTFRIKRNPAKGMKVEVHVPVLQDEVLDF
ncbi:PAS domain S-box protein [Lacibacter sp.]|uniref:PAS domain S-box protein n=1 Tax=Lacibacter sp. TaxID=1915409 RepID=UPI002B4B1B5B|nr:PAS domain S-box protein [Lacibacter sp.]